MKNLAFMFGLFIITVGGVGILAPSGLVWIAQHSVTSGAFYLIATVRVAFGLVLISHVGVFDLSPVCLTNPL